MARVGRVIDIGDIEAAAARLSGIVVETPLLRNIELDQVTGGTVLVKPECLQVSGSFKIRGAYNFLSQLTEAEANSGVVTASSGNHAQGVAAAGRMLGIRTAIVMPEDAPAAKLANTRRLGGEVITYDRYTEDRELIARNIAEERGSVLVSAFDHERIIAGQGTVGLEIARQSAALGLPVQRALFCCGGGGLVAGSAVALKAMFPGVDVRSVEPEGFDDTARSLALGERVAVDASARSICDALQAPQPGQVTFPINQRLLGEGLSVSDDEVCEAIRFAFRHLKLVVEPGGAVALAAVLAGKIDTSGKTTAVVLSGGNVDAEVFAGIQNAASG